MPRSKPMHKWITTPEALTLLAKHGRKMTRQRLHVLRDELAPEKEWRWDRGTLLYCREAIKALASKHNDPPDATDGA